MMIIMMMGTRNSVSVSLSGSSPLHMILVVADFFFLSRKRCMGKQFAQLSFNARI
jgi:hypothetical protein